MSASSPAIAVEAVPAEQVEVDELLAFGTRNAAWLGDGVRPPSTPEAWQSVTEDATQQWYAIVRRGGRTSEVLGVVVLSRWAPEPWRAAEIGFGVDADYAGRGLIQTAVPPILERYLSGELARIEARVDPANLRSTRALRRLGFHYEGQARGCLDAGDGRVTHEQWAIVSGDPIASGKGPSLRHRDLFSVPMWSASVSRDTPWIAHLVRDIDRLLDDGDGMAFETSSGHQTKPNLQDRTESHWQAFFSFATRTFEAVAATAGQVRWPHHGLRAWGLRIDSQSIQKDLEFGPARTLLTHNHAPALLTSVFTCELPESLGPDHVSTVFYNPAAHMVCPWQPRTVLVPPAVGELAVFPGWIEHAAPIVAPMPAGERRVIISVDYFPELEPPTRNMTSGSA